jgi:hypothetical protein
VAGYGPQSSNLVDDDKIYNYSHNFGGGVKPDIWTVTQDP